MEGQSLPHMMPVLVLTSISRGQDHAGKGEYRLYAGRHLPMPHGSRDLLPIYTRTGLLTTSRGAS